MKCGKTQKISFLLVHNFHDVLAVYVQCLVVQRHKREPDRGIMVSICCEPALLLLQKKNELNNY